MTIQNVSKPVIACLMAMGLYAGSASAALTHRYSFTDGVKDSVGKIDGKLKGTAKVADGKLELKNDDVSSSDAKISYLAFDEALMPKSGSASLVIWFTAKDVGSYARLINIGQTEAGEGHSFIYVTPHTADGNSRAAITATDVSGRIFVDNSALDDGKPHCMAIVIDGTAKKLHVFIDGKEATAGEDLGENTLDKVKQMDNWIGRSSFDADAGLTATIDEFRVYDHALSADEAAAINKAGADALPAK